LSQSGALQNFFGNIFCCGFRLVLIVFCFTAKRTRSFVSDCETEAFNVDVEMSLFFSMFFYVLKYNGAALLLLRSIGRHETGLLTSLKRFHPVFNSACAKRSFNTSLLNIPKKKLALFFNIADVSWLS
jgi:hypothetical protein